MKAVLPALLAIGLASCAAPTPPAAPEAAAPAARSNVAKKAAPKPKPYPLETCLVTGDDLDEMDERVSLVHRGQTFEFCCKPCVKKFRQNPDKYVRALEKAKG